MQQKETLIERQNNKKVVPPHLEKAFYFNFQLSYRRELIIYSINYKQCNFSHKINYFE